MTFVRYSTGYRAGGFNARAVAAVDPVYQPEKLKVLEGGVKADFFDKRLRVNASAYHSRYRNLQVTQFVPQDPLGGGGNQTVNANAKYDGFELEVQAAPVEGLTLTATYGYVKPKYTSFPRALDAGRVSPGCTPLVAVTGTTVGQDCAAIAEFTYFPKKTGDASIRYEFPAEDYGTWSVFLAYQYRGRTEMSQFDLPSTPFQDVVAAKAYGIVNGRIALSDIPIGAARAELALFGNNLLNKDYNAQGIDFGSFAAVIFGVPRTVGLEGRIEF
jgi:iron complex outermembrane receptor protein